jgi:two-component system chemotaxis response regulator CheY
MEKYCIIQRVNQIDPQFHIFSFTQGLTLPILYAMTYRFDNTSVLVVDDLRPMLSLTSSILKIFGFKQIHVASNAEDAFIKFCQYNPDLVITDWQMEPFDGIELIKKIRTDPQSPNHFVPIIMMTGYSARQRVFESRDKGVTEFLVKPFSAKDLYARVEQLIEKPRKFVDAEKFFGPDRRRRKDEDYGGKRRRHVELKVKEEETSQRIEGILKKLREEADKNKGKP